MTTAQSLISDVCPILATDPDEASAKVGEVFSPHQLDVVGSSSSFSVVLRRIHLPRITLGELSHGAEVEVLPGRLGTYYNVNVVLSGHTRTSCGREIRATSAGNAAVLSPDGRSTMRWSADCRQLAVKIDRTALECELGALLGHPIEAPIVFDVLLDTKTGLGKAWLRTVTAMIEQVNEAPCILDKNLITSRFESLLIGQLLSTQPHNYTDELTRGEHTPVRPRRIQAVLDVIDRRAADPLTAADLARVAGISLRSLQDDFREQMGVPMMAYLRNVRLARAHENLQREAGNPHSSASVSDVAYRWGFGHVPRFAAAYRERYGQAPSATLRNR